jgi:FkbM family methyltransferase
MTTWRNTYTYVFKILNRVKLRTITAHLGGVNWSLDLNNALDVSLRRNSGVYHNAMPLLFLALDSSFAAVDVGANCGYWTLPLAKKFSHCFSIEADIENFDKLSKNISLNPSLKNRVTALNAAATNYDGEAEINIRRSIDADANLNTGLSSIVIQDAESSSRKVKAVQVDSIVSATAKRVGFIKIDVEGAEFEVLSGATQLIKSDSPYIFWEATLSLDIKFKRENVLLSWDFLVNRGYQNFIVRESGEVIKCTSMKDLTDVGLDVDILSVHDSNVDEFIRKFYMPT